MQNQNGPSPASPQARGFVLTLNKMGRIMASQDSDSGAPLHMMPGPSVSTVCSSGHLCSACSSTLGLPSSVNSAFLSLVCLGIGFSQNLYAVALNHGLWTHILLGSRVALNRCIISPSLNFLIYEMEVVKVSLIGLLRCLNTH